MELTLWTYEGPPHVGAMRIATSMEGVHYVLHAPQGDTYADLLFTMIERRGRRPPVTYTTFQARDLGGDTADLVIRTIRQAVDRFQPEALLVGESCTAELIQDQPGALAGGMDLGVPMVNLELPAYSKKENWGAAETFYQLVRGLLKSQLPPPGTTKPSPSRWREEGRRPRVNLLGPSLLGFRCRDDVLEITRLLAEHGIDVAVVAPLGARPADLLRIPAADANVCLYPEVAGPACSWLERSFGTPVVRTVPIGIGATADFLRELHAVLDLELPAELQTADGQPSEAERCSRLPWYSRSVDSTYLTGKRVFIFADATHAIAAARIASRELGFQVVGLGSYSREQAREVRVAAAELGLEALITDDYLTVEKAMAEAARRARARHPDGAPQRQTAGAALRGDQRAPACAGRAGPLCPPDGLGGGERAVRLLGAPADDGPGGTPDRHVPPRLRIRGRPPQPPGRRRPVGEPRRRCGARGCGGRGCGRGTGRRGGGG